MQKAFVLTPGPDWNANYMFIVKALVENLNIDIGKIYAVSLASGSTTMWNTIYNNPGVFAAQLSCAYDPYHSFAGGSSPFEDRARYAEDRFSTIMDDLPGWYFAGLNDASGSPVSGDPLARYKGERLRDLGLLMNTRGHKVDVSWGEKGELMWNGILRGTKAEIMARTQLARAAASEADHLVTLFYPNTVLQSAHWSWISSYTNAVVREWLYAQTNSEPIGTANIEAPVAETPPTTPLTPSTPSSGSSSNTPTPIDPNIPDPPLAGGTFPFDDVRANDWFYGDVYYVWENGLMNGTANNLFSPNATLSRGMVVTVLYRMEGAPDVSGAAMPFSDAAGGSWYYDAVKWAAENGIALGFEDGTYRPNDNVTREQLAALLFRYADCVGDTLPKNRNYAAFPDQNKITGYALEPVEALFCAEVINGRANGSFDPQGNATRAEFAAMIHRYLTAVD